MRSNSKRRGSIFALVLVLALFAAACSSDDSTDTTEASGGEDTTTTAAPMAGDGVEVGMAFDIGGRGDQSFNDSAAEGLERAITDYGISAQSSKPTLAARTVKRTFASSQRPAMTCSSLLGSPSLKA